LGVYPTVDFSVHNNSDPVQIKKQPYFGNHRTAAAIGDLPNKERRLYKYHRPNPFVVSRIKKFSERRIEKNSGRS
jgi:hypothetical protein